jgi:hypothetical protein
VCGSNLFSLISSILNQTSNMESSGNCLNNYIINLASRIHTWVVHWPVLRARPNSMLACLAPTLACLSSCLGHRLATPHQGRCCSRCLVAPPTLSSVGWPRVLLWRRYARSRRSRALYTARRRRSSLSYLRLSLVPVAKEG